MSSSTQEKSFTVISKGKSPHALPPLPYAENALQPVISSNTLSFHYGKHHKTYIDNLNKLVAGTELAELTLEEVVKKTSKVPEKVGIFNNAAQSWNHAFYWHSMKPAGGSKPSAEIGKLINESFGDFDTFKKEFGNAAVTQFGSGWAWLVKDGSKLKIVKTANAGTPITDGLQPLLTVDVWEHAYYLDYQNRRADYVNGLIDNLLNWEFAESNLK